MSGLQRDLLIAAAFWLALVSVAQVQPVDLEAQIQRAEELNVTASLEESQAALDALQAYMDAATQRQRDRVALLHARNMSVAGDSQGALEHLAPLLDEATDPDLRLDAYRISANIALNLDDFEQGYRHLRAGLDLLPEVEAPEPRVKLLAVANWFFAMAGEPETAVEFSDRALTLARDSGNPRMTCIALGELSIAQENRGRLDAAFENAERALEACEQAGDPIMRSVYRLRVGELLIQRGETARGLATIREGLAQVEESGFRDGVIDGQIALAEALLADGRPEGAEAILTPLVPEVESLGYWRNLRQIHRSLARIAEGRGDHEAALEHTRAAAEADEKLLSRQRALRVAYLQADFEIQAKEQQIALLRERNRVLELQDQTGRQRNVLAIGGFAAVSVIVVLLFMLLMRSRSDRRYLLWLSQRDGLTGLRNHTSFFRQANEALLVARDAGQPFTLVVADIDLFKSINDRFGHITGDSVLRQVGETLQSVFEPVGIVGRLGGEEFAIALPGLRTARARELIAEFNQRLRPLHEDGRYVPITLSYGLTEMGDDRSTEFMRRFADEALYEAKRRGRDCIVDAAEVCDEATIRSRMNRRADDPH